MICKAKEERTANHRNLFLKAPTLNIGYLNDRAEIAIVNSMPIIAVKSCVRASNRLYELSHGKCAK